MSHEPLHYCISDVLKVEFYKVDQLTTDLICCELTLGDGPQIRLHEDLPQWERDMARLANLDGFDKNWFAKVSQPPFASCNTIAYEV